MSCDDNYDIYADYKACAKNFGTTTYEGKIFANTNEYEFVSTIGLRKFMMDEKGQTYVLIHESIETDGEGDDWFIHTPILLVTLQEYKKIGV